MALVKCEECGKEISSNVKVCPHCGYKRKRGIWFYIMIFLIAIIILAVLGSNNDDSKLGTNSTEKSSASTVKKELYLTEIEKNIFHTLIQNQTEALINGGEPIFSNDENIVIPRVISANTIQLEYEKNEINADNLFKNKLLLVSGKVINISKNSSNEPSLSLSGGSNPYMTPDAKMKKEYIDWASNLSKGTEVQMICKINHFIMGSVKLHNCIPFDSWFNEMFFCSKNCLFSIFAKSSKELFIFFNLSDMFNTSTIVLASFSLRSSDSNNNSNLFMIIAMGV